MTTVGFKGLSAFGYINSVCPSVRDKSGHCETLRDRPMVNMGSL